MAGGPKQTTVPITVRTKVKALRVLHERTFPSVSVDMTWIDFLQQVLNMKFDPLQYFAKTLTGHRHSLLENIRELMCEFKQIRKSFVVVFVENSGRFAKNFQAVKQIVPPPPEASASSLSVQTGSSSATTATNGHTQNGANNSIKNGPSSSNNKNSTKNKNSGSAAARATPKSKKQRANTNNEEHKREPSPTTAASIVSNHTIPIENRRIYTPPTNQNGGRNNVASGSANRGQKRPAHGGMHPPPQRVKFPEDDMILPGSANKPNGNIQFDDDDLDDSASQASQESQDDLEAAGVRIEDIKPNVLDKMLSGVSNAQMLRIREELRGVTADGKWLRAVSRIPQAGLFLKEIFSI